MQSPMLEFQSDGFPVTPGEDERTNPGIYGESLAEWLRLELGKAGVPARDVIAEDFGWCVPVKSTQSVYVACASSEDGTNQWRVFLFAEGGLLARALGKDRRAESLSELYAIVRRCLEARRDVINLREVSG